MPDIYTPILMSSGQLAFIAGATHLQDSPFVVSDRGFLTLGVRQDTPVDATTTNGDYTQLTTNRYGWMYVEASGRTPVGSVPNAAVNPLEVGALFQNSDPVIAGTDGQVGRMRLDSYRRLFVTDPASVSVAGYFYSEDAPHTSGDKGIQFLGVRNDYALTSLTTTNGDYSSVSTDSKGVVFTRQDAASPTSTLGNYSTAVGNGTAVRLADTTITFVAAGVVSNQLRKVIVSVAPGLDVTWEQGVNATLTLSGTTLTVVPANGAAAPVPAGTTVVVEWVGEVKGYDPSLQANRVQPISSDRSFRQPGVALIAASQTITVNWADLGPEVLVDGSNSVGLYVNVDVNDAVNVRFRALAKLTNGGAIEYMLPTKVVNSTATPWLVQAEGNVFEWNIDGTDFAVLIPFGLENIVQYVQFQVMCGAVGATAGIVLAADYTQGW